MLTSHQLILGATVVGLSAVLVKQQVIGGAPVTLRYSVFTGAWTMVIAVIGLVLLFIHKIPPLVTMVLDALTGLFLVAGGIAWAIGLRGVKCDSAYGEKMLSKPLLNEGCTTIEGRNTCGIAGRENPLDALIGRCKTGMADEIIQFVGFAICVILVILGFFIMRRATTTSSRGRFSV